MFLFLSLGRYLCWWTIRSRGYHSPPVVSVSTLAWSIIYIYVSMFLLLSLSRYLCWRTISPWGYHTLTHPTPVVSVSALTWFIRYSYVWNINLLKLNLISLWHRWYIWLWLSCLGSLVLFSFSFFWLCWLRMYPMKVVPETCREHKFKYLLFFFFFTAPSNRKFSPTLSLILYSTLLHLYQHTVPTGPTFNRTFWPFIFSDKYSPSQNQKKKPPY
jgi:hypothetical protein